MSNLLLMTHEQSESSATNNWAPEIVVAGTRFSTESGNYFVNGRQIGRTAWHEQLRGARELHRVVCEIYELYPIEMSSCD